MSTPRTQPTAGPGRARHLRPAALAAGLCLALLTACGGSGSGVTPEPAGAGGATSTGPATVLTVVAGDGSGAATTWTLTCEPTGGNHPDAAAACAALAKSGETALPATAADQMCTQIYGGPQTATVTGTWRGKQVTASFNRTNGCEVARWEALAALLPSTAS